MPQEGKHFVGRGTVIRETNRWFIPPAVGWSYNYPNFKNKTWTASLSPPHSSKSTARCISSNHTFNNCCFRLRLIKGRFLVHVFLPQLNDSQCRRGLWRHLKIFFSPCGVKKWIFHMYHSCERFVFNSGGPRSVGLEWLFFRTTSTWGLRLGEFPFRLLK